MVKSTKTLMLSLPLHSHHSQTDAEELAESIHPLDSQSEGS